MASLKSNIILNFINTLTGIIFPILTFPYAARVLLPEGIGCVNFLNSIINYLILLTSIGIPLYAVREVAKYRNNVYLRNKITIEILTLSLILCVLGYFLVWLIGENVSQIHVHKNLFYVLSLSILFTGIGIQWFYQAVEDFKYITIRAIIIRSLSALSLFLFVKDQYDLLIYCCVLVGTSVGNNLLNFIHLRKYVSMNAIKWKELQPFKHLAPALRIFVLNLIISLYAGLDTIMLGFLVGDVSVGYYSAGTKLTHVVLSLVTSLGAVMLPRCSNLVKTGNIRQFGEITRKAAQFVIAVSMPLCVGLIMLSYPITVLFFGNEFYLSANVLVYTIPIIIFTGLTNVIGIQILYPQGLEKIVIYSVTGGALINITLNLFLIPTMHQDGAAIATFFAELVVLLIQVSLGRKYIPFKISELNISNYLFGSLLILISILIFKQFFNNNILLILCSCFFSVVLYFSFLYYKKDQILNEVLKVFFHLK